jgi:hypothetical protein
MWATLCSTCDMCDPSFFISPAYSPLLFVNFCVMAYRWLGAHKLGCSTSFKRIR